MHAGAMPRASSSKPARWPSTIFEKMDLQGKHLIHVQMFEVCRQQMPWACNSGKHAMVGGQAWVAGTNAHLMTSAEGI